MPPLTRLLRFHSDVSRNSEISLQCYLRSGDSLASQQDAKDGQGDDVMGVGDIYLGGIKFVPDFGNQVGIADRMGALSGNTDDVPFYRLLQTIGILSVEDLVKSISKCHTGASIPLRSTWKHLSCSR